MPPIPASFGSSALLSYGLVGRSRIVLPAPPYTSRDLYIFASSTSFNFGAARTFEYLVVGGGGGGGSGFGGGGGGGGIRVGTSTTPSPGTLQIYVGGGGAPNANGGNSGFWHPAPFVPTSVWADGGGRGGGTDLTQPSANGGSGGGGYGGQNPLIGFGGFATTSPFGNAGGVGGYYSGGGGGANSAGGFGVSANNVKMVKASIYSTYGSGTRGGNYSVQWSNNGISWTTSFSGVMSSNSCGIFEGSITSSPSLGRYPFWRYVVGSNTATHHPRSSRIYLTDEYNNNYQLAAFTDDNCSDLGVIPAPGDIYTVYETGLSSPATKSGNGGSAFISTITGFATPFGAGGGNMQFNGAGGDWSAGGTAPSPSASGMQRRGGGGAGGGGGSPAGSGGSGVVIISTPRALGPAADNTQLSFANTTTWQAPTGLTTIELLLVAGGGGGGGVGGGGGGAGGVRFTPSFPVSPGLTYTVTIGAGGAAQNMFAPFYPTTGATGGDTSFSGPGITTRTTSGGGGGGSSADVPSVANPGGSGGGGANQRTAEVTGPLAPGGYYLGPVTRAGASGNTGGYTPAEGFGGGGSNGVEFGRSGGGGGGAGGAGATVPGYNVANNIATTAGDYRGAPGGTGVTFLFHSVGGGGGGGNRASAPAPSTTWGGGLGASSTAPHARDYNAPYGAIAPATGSYATVGRFASGGGGGGGGAEYMGNPNDYGGFEQAASGGSGLVVIRYAGSYPYIPYYSADLDNPTFLNPDNQGDTTGPPY